MLTIEYHRDAGHGWLKIAVNVAADLGLRDRDFTRYSYRDFTHYYLEEDCDAATLMDVIKHNGVKHEIVVIDDGDRSPIRDKYRITP